MIDSFLKRKTAVEMRASTYIFVYHRLKQDKEQYLCLISK